MMSNVIPREEVTEKPVLYNQSTTGIKKILTAIWDDLLAQSGFVAYLPVIITVILMFSGLAWQIFFPYTDVARYQCYALTFWLGGHAVNFLPATQCTFLHLTVPAQGPFQMLPLEYPPLTLVLFSLSLLAPIPYYQLVFALLMALTTALIYWLLLRFGPRGTALTFAFFALAGSWAIAEGRFDMVPAALTLICIIAAERKHWTYAYIALAFAVLLKLYPILFFPALFIAEQRDAQRMHIPSLSMKPREAPAELWRTLRGIGHWRWKNILIFFGTLIAITGAFALLDFQSAVTNQISYFINRPVQIESTSSSILWVATGLGFPIHAIYTFGSLNITSALSGIVSSFFSLLFVLGFAYTIWLQWRGKLDVVQTCIALLFVFMSTGKVFSPQYLIWLMPLLAYCSGLDVFWLVVWGGISLMTTFIYPYLYTRTNNILHAIYVPGFIQIVAIRNVLFVLLTLTYLFNWFGVRRRKPFPPRLPGPETKPLNVERPLEVAETP